MRLTTEKQNRKLLTILLVATLPLLLLTFAGLQLATAAEQQGAAFEITAAELGISKTASASTVTAGDRLTYTLTVNNSGTLSATNVVVSDSLPSGVTTATLSTSVDGAACNASGNPIVCSLGDLEVGVTAYITLEVDVDLDTSGVIVNNAEVGSDNTGANDTDAEPVTVLALADLSLRKDVNAVSVFPSEQLTYTLTVSNAGPSAASNVSISDTLPDGTSYVSSIGTTCTGSNNQYNCPVPGPLAVDASAVISVVVSVDPGASGTLTNLAEVSSDAVDNDETDNDDSAASTVDPLADLSLLKDVNTASVFPGELLTYTLTVHNAGPSAASNVTISDTLPQGTSYVSSIGTTCTGSNNEYDCPVPGPIAANASAVISVVVSVDPGASGTLTNLAEVSSDAVDNDETDNDDSAVSTVVPLADLNLLKDVNTASVFPGELLTYTLIVHNAGPSTASNVTISDTLPQGTSYVSSIGTSCIGSNNEYDCPVPGPIAANASAVITIVVSVDPDASGSLTNLAEVSSDIFDDDTTDNDDSATSTVNPLADLSLIKDVNAPSVFAGQQLTYTLIVSNAGPSAASNVNISDTLPPGTSYISDTGADCTDTSNLLDCSVPGPLAANAGAVITLVVGVDTGDSGTLTNLAEVSSDAADLDATDNDDSAVSTVIPQADLSLIKTVNAASVFTGEQLTYTLTISNAGPSVATGLTLSDTTPLGTIFDSVDGVKCIGPKRPLNCTIADPLAAGASVVVTVVVNVDAGASGTLTNQAEVASAIYDDDTANNHDSAATTVIAVADLSLLKDVNAASVFPGQHLTYSLTVNNAGPNDAGNIIISDTLPPGTSYVGSIGTTCTGSNDRYFCPVPGPLASGASAVITLVVSVDLDASGGLTNLAEVSGDAVDLDTTDNDDSAVSTVEPLAGLSLIKDVNAASVLPGENLTYTLTVHNAGPSAASNVIISDTLPQGTSYVSSIGTTCTASDNHYDCPLPGPLAAAASAVITVVVSVDLDASGTLTNLAEVSSDAADDDTSDNDDTAASVVNAVADLSLLKDVNAASVFPGQQLTYTLTVHNAGPSDAGNIIISDTLPPGTSYVGSIGTTCTGSNDRYDCPVPGTLASGASAVITVVVSVDLDASGGLTNLAEVSGDAIDEDTGNNDDSAVSTVEPLTDLSLLKDVNAASVLPGENLTYTLTVHNAGPSAASNVNISDTLPQGTSFASSIGTTCTGSNNQYDCPVPGPLAPDASAVITVVVSVDLDASGALTNLAEVSSDTFDDDETNNDASAVSSINSVSDLNLLKTSASDTVVAGERLTYTLAISNAGPSVATGVTISDTLPPSTTLFAYSSEPAGASCTNNNNVLDCDMDSLAASAGSVLTLYVDVDPGANGSLTNYADVSSAAIDSALGDNLDSASVTVNSKADLSLDKTASAASAIAGQRLTYTLTVANDGPSVASNVLVTDTLPVSTSLFSASTSVQGVVCTDHGDYVVCPFASLDADSDAVITLVVDVDVDVAAADSLTNTAQVGSPTPDPNDGNNQDMVVTALRLDADLSLSKTANPTTVVAGDLLTYTLTVINNGPSVAIGANVTDTLPGDVELLSWMPSHPGIICTNDSGVVVCSLGDLDFEDSEVITLVVDVDPATTGSLVNNALVRSSTIDNVIDNNSAILPTTVVREVDVNVGKAGRPNPVAAGEIITYTVVINNSGPSVATNVQLIDTLPVSATIISATRQLDPANIQVIDAFLFTPPSPDTAGITYLGTTNRLLASDSEVNETDLFDDANLFDVTLDGTLFRTGLTMAYSDEPTGLAYDPLTDRIFVSDDTGIRSIYILEAGSDGLHGTDDDIVSSIPTNAFGSNDPEGLAFDTHERVLFELDGLGAEVFRIDPGPSGQFNGPPVAGDDIVTSFDVAALGIVDPEGLAFNPESRTLFIGDHRRPKIIETTTDGILLRTIDISLAGSDVGGLTYAPNSINQDARSLYIADRGIDNQAIPDENDGRIWEVALPAAADTELNCSPGPLVVCDIGTLPPDGLAIVTFRVQVDARTTISIENKIEVSSDGPETNPGNNTATDVTTVVSETDLAIIKSAEPSPVTAGERLTYTLTISNYGPSIATGVTVTDSLASEAIYVSSSTSVGVDCTPGETIICALGELAVGTSAQITITTDITSSAVFSIENLALVGGDQIDPITGNNQALVVTAINRSGSLPLMKLIEPEQVFAGANVTYTLIVSSAGPSSVMGVVLTDVLPSQVTFLTMTHSSGTCSFNIGTVSCQLGDMAVGDGVTIQIVAQVDPAFGGLLSNTAIVTGEDALAGQATQNTVVAGSADLAVLSWATPTSVMAGQSLTYTVVVSNNGPSLAQQVMVNNTLPADSIFKESLNCGPSGASIICNLGDLAPAASVTATFAVDVDPGAVNAQTSSSTVFATTNDPDLSNNSSIAAAQVNTVSDLGIDKWASSLEVVAGETLTYSLTISNSGPSDATGVQVSDTLPPGVRLLSAGASQGACGSANPVECELGTIPISGTVAMTVVVQVLPSTTGVLVNSVSVTADPLDPNDSNNQADESTTVTTLANLNIAKIDATDPITAGVNLGYLLTVGNAGPSNALGVVLTDTLPDGLTPISAIPTQGGPCDLVGPITCPLGAIAPGQIVSVSLVVSVSSTLTQPLLNNASVASVTSDPDPADNSTDEVTAVVTSADLALWLAGTPDPVFAGESLTYTLAITNNGPSDASSILLSDQIPAVATLHSAEASQGLACIGSSTVECFLGDLAIGQTASVTIVVTLDPGLVPALLENNATVSGSTSDPNVSNNARQSLIALETLTDLEIVKEANPDPVAAGNELTYTLTISNHGPSNASGVVVSDSLPAAATFVSVESSQGLACTPGATVQCNLGELAVGANAQITIVTTISAAATSIVENTAVVDGDQVDPDESNNQAQLITSVNQQGSLPLTMLDDPDPVTGGSNLTYTLFISSAGPSNATNVVLTDTLPTEVTFVSVTYSRGVCGYAAGAINCLLGNMPVDSDATVIIKVKVDPAADGQINNSAIVGADGAVPSNINENTRVEGSANLALTNSAAPSTVVAGESLTITIDVTNNGPSVAKQTIVNSTLPAGTTFKGGPGCSQLGSAIICDLGDLPVNGVVSTHFVVDVDTDTLGEISSFSSAFSTTSDPELANNTSEATAQANAVSDLGISKQALSTDVLAGREVTYTLTISNSGPSDATNVQVSDNLPAGVKLLSATASQGSCNPTQPVDCSLGVMPPNASAVVTVTVQILPATTGQVINDASVTADPFDPNEANNDNSVLITVNTLANLNIGKIDATDPITAGVRLTYLITVGNAGPSAARNVVLTDTLPVGLTPFSATPSQGGPCDLSGPVTCSLGNIAPGQIVSVSLVVDVSSAQIAGLVNNVIVGSDTAEFDPADNSTAEDTAVLTAANLALKLVGAPDPVIAGELMTYTLTITNNGPSDATGIVVTTTLPAEVRLQEISPGGTSCNGTVEVVCGFSSMSADSAAIVTFRVRVEPEIAATIITSATINAEQTDPVPENDSASESTVIQQNVYLVRLPMVFSGMKSDEPNNQPCQAFGILPNYDYAFMPNDVSDWYTFDLPSEGIMTVELTNFTPLIGQIVAYKGADCDSRNLLAQVGNPGLAETLNLGLQGPGRYYIFVGSDGALSTTNPYGLRVSVAAPPG